MGSALIRENSISICYDYFLVSARSIVKRYWRKPGKGFEGPAGEIALEVSVISALLQNRHFKTSALLVGILLLREKRDQGGTHGYFSRQRAQNAYDHECFVSTDIVIRPLLNRAHKEP